MTRAEFAKNQGITVDNLKKRMKRGYYKNQYVMHNGKYFFTTSEGMRPNQVTSPGTNVPRRKRNRGSHFNNNYPNTSFQTHNELKMLARLKGQVDPVEQELLPEAMKIAKQKKQERIIEATKPEIKKDYGRMIYQWNSSPMVTFKTPFTEIFEKEKNEYDRYLEENERLGITNSNTKKFYW